MKKNKIKKQYKTVLVVFITILVIVSSVPIVIGQNEQNTKFYEDNILEPEALIDQFDEPTQQQIIQILDSGKAIYIVVSNSEGGKAGHIFVPFFGIVWYRSLSAVTSVYKIDLTGFDLIREVHGRHIVVFGGLGYIKRFERPWFNGPGGFKGVSLFQPLILDLPL